VTRDCAGGSQSEDPGAACGCDYALGEQYRCMREVDGQKVECGCYTCPRDFPQMVGFQIGESASIVCYERCPETAGKPSQFYATATPARWNSTVTPALTTPESFPAPNNSIPADRKPAPVGKECHEGGSEYEGYHTGYCMYTSGTPEQNGHHCEKDAAGCECFCWGCPEPQSQEGPVGVIQEDDDGRRNFTCFERCEQAIPYGTSRRCADPARPDTCRCYPEPESGSARLVDVTLLKCCTPEGDWGRFECMDLISKQVVESTAVSSVAKPPDTDCGAMSTQTSLSEMRCFHSETRRGCSPGEAKCECRCYSCDDPMFPSFRVDGVEHNEFKCYAACPEHHQLRCEEDTCACFSCTMQPNWPADADAYSEFRGVRSVLKAQCPNALAHPGALRETEAFFIADKGMPPHPDRDCTVRSSVCVMSVCMRV